MKDETKRSLKGWIALVIWQSYLIGCWMIFDHDWAAFMQIWPVVLFGLGLLYIYVYEWFLKQEEWRAYCKRNNLDKFGRHNNRKI